jgi:hypothetical protein
MRTESSVTSISWIPTEAMSGLMKVPMDLGIGHYDEPPPDHIEPDDLEQLRADNRFRFANRLAVWVDVEDGQIVDSGYSGGGLVGLTKITTGFSVSIPGVSFPVIQELPVVSADSVRFQQTAGGRTGAPIPRTIDHPPYVRITAPSAWTTLALTITIAGDCHFELVGASPFPRHWIYGPDGEIAATSGLIDYGEWTRVHDHDHSPWHDFEREVLMSDVESKVERELSKVVMSGQPEFRKLEEGSHLTKQGQVGGSIYLILDGMLRVAVDGNDIAELGPGAIVGERAVLEGGAATATVTATTPVRIAEVPAEDLDRTALEAVAAGHRRERAS